MKNKVTALSFVLLVLIFSACSSSEESTKEVKEEKINLVVDYSFAGIENGYDHQVKIEVFSNDIKVGESNPHLQSEPSSASFGINKGNQKLKFLVSVNFNGNWEEHLKANDYAIDAVYETELDAQSDQKIKLLFDLDKGTIREYN
jgi:hypothetical protein